MTIRNVHAVSALVTFFAAPALFTHLGCAACWRSNDLAHLPIMLTVAVRMLAGTVVALLILRALFGSLVSIDIPAADKAIHAQPSI